MPKAPAEKRELPPFLRTDIPAKERKKKQKSPPETVKEDDSEVVSLKKSSGKKARSPKGKALRHNNVVYPEVVAEIFIGEEAMSDDQARDILGWQTESTDIKFDKDYPFHFRDTRDVKVRCNNNLRNRMLYMGVVNRLKQEQLRRRWKFNGEPVIIGKTGMLLNGQHSLISFIFACQEYDDFHNTKDLGRKRPTLEKLVVYGVDEDDDIVNTLDTCKGRSLMDVIYRSEFFANLAGKDRRMLSKITDKAVTLLWDRTGVSLEKVYKTHAESLDFIGRHPKIMDCAKHIYEENGSEGKITKYIGPGAAAGLLYLFGSSKTERETAKKDGYSDVPVPTEELLDWGSWDKACDFFTKLAAGDKKFIPVRQAMAECAEQMGQLTQAAKVGVIINAWNCWSKHGGFAAEDIVLEFDQTEDEETTIVDHPNAGGIDLGRV